MEKYQKELALVKKTVKDALATLNVNKEIMIKSNQDLVTSSDLHIEKHLIEMIKTNFPSDHILSEETYNMEVLQNRTWIIDPIDGTSNYAVNLELYCIQVALYDEGDLVLSYIDIPKLNKEYYAIKDSGAYLNNQRIYTSKATVLSNSLISFIGAYKKDALASNLTQHYLTMASEHNMKIRMLGSVGVELALVAEGIFVGAYTTVSNLWDIAPGILLIKEAGGYLANCDNMEYIMGKRPLFAWSNQDLYTKFIK